MPNFVKGLFVSQREQAPSFIIASLSFNEKFIDWLKDNMNSNGYCNVDLKKSKEGKPYAELNTWKPKIEGIDTAEEIDTSKIPF